MSSLTQEEIALHIKYLDAQVKEYERQRRTFSAMCNHADYEAHDEHYYCTVCGRCLGDVDDRMFDWIPAPGSYLKRCPTCKGNPGVLDEADLNGIMMYVPCPDCGSKGYGSVPPGWIPSLNVYIPGEDKA